MFECRIENEEGKTVSRRTLSWSDYFSFLGKTLVEKPHYAEVTPMQIPRGFLKGWFLDSENYTCIFKVDAKKRQFVLKGCGHYMVPFPDMVFVIGINKGQVVEKKCFCLGKDGETLFQYPFGNVSCDGGICMGNIDYRNLSLEEITEEFFLGVTNNDYWEKGNHITDDTLSQQQFVEKVDGKDEIPQKYLIKCSTLEELIARHSKEGRCY
jgi:hypothetical protein